MQDKFNKVFKFLRINLLLKIMPKLRMLIVKCIDLLLRTFHCSTDDDNINTKRSM